MKISKFVIFCLFFVPFQTHADADAKAKIITSANQAAKCISPVQILNIDGSEVKVQHMGFDLDPGKHTMSGRALIDATYCKTVGKSTNRYGTTPLEAEFEAGKSYWVGFDHSSPDRNEWKYVIWKVKD